MQPKQNKMGIVLCPHSSPPYVEVAESGSEVEAGGGGCAATAAKEFFANPASTEMATSESGSRGSWSWWTGVGGGGGREGAEEEDGEGPPQWGQM